MDGGILFTAHGGIWTGEVTGLRRSKKCLARSCRGATGPLSACGLPQTALTRGQLSFAPSLDRFFANLFFFLWSGLDSRIISSSSNVGSQFNLPFCKENNGLPVTGFHFHSFVESVTAYSCGDVSVAWFFFSFF